MVAQLCLTLFKNEFIEIATKLSAVVACRCSPTQKADVARLIRDFTKKRICCIGDGGNDVSMIQAADVGPCLSAFFSLHFLIFLPLIRSRYCWQGRQASIARCRFLRHPVFVPDQTLTLARPQLLSSLG
jgi:P-type E1-E2 ATPase